jgi:hypothetical protein
LSKHTGENSLERSLLTAILALFILLSVTYSVVVPPFEASDELWHYPMVKYIADHWSLPVQEPGVETPWRQEGSQPPLYYFLGALATSWIDTSDIAQVRHLNPHADNGIATPDGNVNLVVHQPRREAFPWRGTVLAIHIVRFLSVLMMTAGVYLTYRVVQEVFPQPPWLALGAAAIHAFTPMVVFIAGAVNNDNLVVPLSSLALLMLIRIANERISESANERKVTWKIPVARYLMLGVVLGLAALTKTSSLGLTLLTAIVVTVRAVRHPEHVGGWREFFVGGFCTLLPVLAIAGWWYLRNLRLYGDLTGLNVFIEILGQRDVPADLAQLWRERFSFLAGYWGNFGGLNVPMTPWIYTALNTILIIAALGLILVIASCVIRHSFLNPPFSILHSPFSILHSPFSILHSPFSILHSPFPPLGPRCLRPLDPMGAGHLVLAGAAHLCCAAGLVDAAGAGAERLAAAPLGALGRGSLRALLTSAFGGCALRLDPPGLRAP